MMGTKIRNFAPLPRDVSLEDLVPKDNFYRRLEATLDLSFVRDLVKDCYAPSGRARARRSSFSSLALPVPSEGRHLTLLVPITRDQPQLLHAGDQFLVGQLWGVVASRDRYVVVVLGERHGLRYPVASLPVGPAIVDVQPHRLVVVDAFQ
jgi:hypothetical protein